MRILLFHHPFPLPAGASANRPWANVLAFFAKALKTTESRNEVSVCVPERRRDAFQEALAQYPNAPPVTVYVIPEAQISDVIKRKSATVGEIDRLFYAADNAELKSFSEELLPDSLRKLQPDVILGFGLSVGWLQGIFPDALILDSEASSFSRQPFANSYIFDHKGLFKKSALPQVMTAIKSDQWIPLKRALQLSQVVRSQSFNWSRLAGRMNLGLSYDAKKPRILLALQAGGYSTFDAVVPHRSQFELLFDVMSRARPDVEVLVTEHPTAERFNARFLTDIEMAELTIMFPNISFIQESQKFSQISQMILPFVDGIWTVASNLSQLAAFWGKKVGTPPTSHYSYLSCANDVSALCDNLNKIDEEDRIAREYFFAWQFQHYIVPQIYMRRMNWFSNHLRRRLEAATASQTVEAFPETVKAYDVLDAPTQANGAPIVTFR